MSIFKNWTICSAVSVASISLPCGTPKGFEWLMFEEPKMKQSSIENRQRLGVSLYGNGWPGPRVRWCTGQLKTHLIRKEVNRLKKRAERHALCRDRRR